ncbi:bifunctional 4-hydroxy-2-oxoglutarate aldolase/2-dehydro-3-deoxy-phosphogluconate aldolase [Fulvivirgaceae bacterium BMA10]|uniref:Bifunctional 4-hydroxy-2-oxoglutarate aldolase/2-dehydro-3-deoxy-phosphogluconate aldolase n=1 Tax=Splendidivirga corallicola TaxID=3051826 RepID=A0ABT8KY12_9BACT|nr:bifunctional 4-hydroxy-2-oxoglutarate aldolase/2-dehydro-3-deoxy-phosphogluconate aldolase [Fulvivirgaceae bacterium BMA10]
MNRKEQITETIEQARIMAIIRLKKQEFICPVAEAISEGGIKVLEVTSNTPGYDSAIAKIQKNNPDTLVGAGTVTSVDIAKRAIDAGAQFLVTPNTNPEVALLAHDVQVPVIMGALTPSEVYLADSCGADIIKLFPACSFGIEYFKALKGPYQHMKFAAVGGISVDNIAHWLKAGCIAAGVGGELIHFNQQNLPDKNKIRETAKEFIKRIASLEWEN